MPLIIVSGRNTQSMVSVDAMTEMPTSDVPCTAASLGRSPRARCVETFSSTTMASSTTMPMAMARADIDMMFSVLPLAKRYTSDASSAMGMDSTMMKVDLKLPRKRNTTSITTMNVMMMVSRRVRMVLMISVEPSTRMETFTSVGSVGSILASCFFTPLMTFTVLAPACFWMMIRAERMPSVYDSCSRSSPPSRTVATSLRYTVLPPTEPRTMSSSSEGSVNSFCTRRV